VVPNLKPHPKMATDRLADRPWVLLPGTLCTAAVFDPLLDVLGVDAANRRAVPMDRPDVSDYMPDLDGLSPDTILCGFSLGAIVAVHASAKLTAKTLVLFGVNPLADDPRKAQMRHDLAQDVHALGGARALRDRAPQVWGADPQATRAAIYQMADDTAHLITAQTALALNRPSALPLLAQTSARVFALTGSEDSAAPPHLGQAAAQAAPLGQFCALDALGHFALLEDPAACAAALRAMMDTPA